MSGQSRRGKGKGRGGEGGEGGGRGISVKGRSAKGGTGRGDGGTGGAASRLSGLGQGGLLTKASSTTEPRPAHSLDSLHRHKQLAMLLQSSHALSPSAPPDDGPDPLPQAPNMSPSSFLSSVFGVFRSRHSREPSSRALAQRLDLAPSPSRLCSNPGYDIHSRELTGRQVSKQAVPRPTPLITGSRQWCSCVCTSSFPPKLHCDVTATGPGQTEHGLFDTAIAL